MKKRVLILISLLSALILLASGCVVRFPDEDLPDLDVTEIDPTKYEQLDDTPFRKVLEDNKAILYISTKTTEFALYHKATGKMIYSNPQDRGDSAMPRLNSVIRLSYYDDDDAAKEYLSYTDCNMATSPTVAWTKNDAGDLRLIYTFGKVEEKILCPQIFSKETFDQIKQQIAELDETDSTKNRYNRILDNAYKIYEWNKNGDNDFSVIQMAEEYPAIKEFPVYICGAKALAVRNVQTVLLAIGYTFEMMEAEYEKCLYKPENDIINIRLALDYRLENGELVITVPRDQLWLNRSTTKLAQVHLFEYLAAGTTEQEGSIFIPDGSGALIYWNNGKTNISSLSIPVYGRDKGVIFDMYTENTEGVFLPIYAQTENKDGKPDHTTMVILEKGAEMTNLNIVLADNRSSLYNTVYPSFMYTNVTEVQYIRYTTHYFQKQLPANDVSMRIVSLTGDDADYVGMAKYYREYLIKKGDLVDKDLRDDAYPMNVELVGSADVLRSTAGIPVTTRLRLTGYKDAQEILNGLKEKGLKNLTALYTAWANGGYRHSIMDHVSTIGSLGSERDLKNLFAFCAESGIVIYPEFDIQSVSQDNDGLFDSFISFLHSSRTLNNKVAKDYEYSVSIREPKKIGNFYLLQLKRYDDVYKGFMNGYRKFGNSTVYYSKLGRDLYSDFNQMYGTTRNDSFEKNKEILARTVTDGYQVAVSGANTYAFPYAAAIYNAPVMSSQYYLADESVPFYNIVLHGYTQYYTIPLNTADDYMVLFLRAVETGSGLSFKLIRASNEEIKDVSYGNFYSMNFDLWENTIVELYERANNELAGLQNLTIEDHENLASYVAKTVYSDGTVVYTNYSDEDFALGEGLTVASMDFVVVKGGVR
ncbi:MAG: hypothetical protein KIG36_07255 [Eubacteriales bacterium]|nr:hypothetical protein [Eubacteriales bacterium]